MVGFLGILWSDNSSGSSGSGNPHSKAKASSLAIPTYIQGECEDPIDLQVRSLSYVFRRYGIANSRPFMSDGLSPALVAEDLYSRSNGGGSDRPFSKADQDKLDIMYNRAAFEKLFLEDEHRILIDWQKNKFRSLCILSAEPKDVVASSLTDAFGSNDHSRFCFVILPPNSPDETYIKVLSESCIYMEHNVALNVRRRLVKEALELYPAFELSDDGSERIRNKDDRANIIKTYLNSLAVDIQVQRLYKGTLSHHEKEKEREKGVVDGPMSSPERFIDRSPSRFLDRSPEYSRPQSRVFDRSPSRLDSSFELRAPSRLGGRTSPMRSPDRSPERERLSRLQKPKPYASASLSLKISNSSLRISGSDSGLGQGQGQGQGLMEAPEHGHSGPRRIQHFASIPNLSSSASALASVSGSSTPTCSPSTSPTRMSTSKTLRTKTSMSNLNLGSGGGVLPDLSANMNMNMSPHGSKTGGAGGLSLKTVSPAKDQSSHQSSVVDQKALLQQARLAVKNRLLKEKALIRQTKAPKLVGR